MKKRYFLVNRLGRKIAVSTGSGDFFEVPEPLFRALKKCRQGAGQDLGQALRGQGLDETTIENVLEALGDGAGAARAEKPGVSITDLTLNLTSDCNLACLYCWNEQGRYPNRSFSVRDRAKGRTGLAVPDAQRVCEPAMSAETACKAVDDLLRYRGAEDHLVVDFYGGEPLLNVPVMEEVIRHCRRQEKKTGVAFRFLLATNGTLLSPALADRLTASGVEMAVSIDGPAEVQNYHRPFGDGRPSFPVIESHLRAMNERLLKRLVARATVTPNFPDMVRIYHALREMGFERIELFESEEACHRISPGREAFFFHTEEQYRTYTVEYERLVRLYIEEVKRGHLTHYNTFFNRFFKLMQKLYHHHEVTGGCPAGRGQLAVSSDGGYYPCTAFIGVEDFRMGDVRSGLDVGRLEEFISKADRREEHCSNCSYFALCKSTGSCLNLNLHYNGDISKPWKTGCRMFRFKMDMAMAALAILSDQCPQRLEPLFGSDPSGARGSYLVDKQSPA